MLCTVTYILYLLHSIQEHKLVFHCLILSLNFFKESFSLIFDGIDSHTLGPNYVKLLNP